MSWNKGQVWSYDILAAIVVFMITFAFLAFFWWSVATTTSEPRAEKLAVGVKGLSDSLLSPGNPTDWGNSTGIDPNNADTWGSIYVLGLTEGFGGQEIDQGKAERIVLMSEANYSALKQKLRMNYNFYVEVKEFYNCSEPSIISSPLNCEDRGITEPELSSMEHFASANGVNISFGLEPNANGARSVSVVNRYAIYDGSLALVRVLLWTNQTWQ